ncbi:MAG TPA: hypothetical protein VM144_10505 [Aestuariivirga sp.]|nr:hypothetical protein [Aestuariivirga sp.]
MVKHLWRNDSVILSFFEEFFFRTAPDSSFPPSWHKKTVSALYSTAGTVFYWALTNPSVAQSGKIFLMHACSNAKKAPPLFSGGAL